MKLAKHRIIDGSGQSIDLEFKLEDIEFGCKCWACHTSSMFPSTRTEEIFDLHQHGTLESVLVCVCGEKIKTDLFIKIKSDAVPVSKKYSGFMEG